MDMGAITETLFESELFGHVKGAFTDAREDRVGKFEAANKGTLFLDEIGNLSYALQSKLLATLQSRKVIRVGSNKPIDVNIRLICATNSDLPRMVKEGTFREDLLYRINTITWKFPRYGKEGMTYCYWQRPFYGIMAGNTGNPICPFPARPGNDAGIFMAGKRAGITAHRGKSRDHV